MKKTTFGFLNLPIHFLWSYERVLLWICLLCIFDLIQTHAHISNLEWFCNIRSICRLRHEGLLIRFALLPDRNQHSPLNWTNKRALDCPGMTSKWVRRGWRGALGNGYRSKCDGIVVSRPGTSSPLWWPRRQAMRRRHTLIVIRVLHVMIRRITATGSQITLI